MINPWARIAATDYEGHMKFIKQHELLNRIFKEQINDNDYSNICILGIGCGNGLEHIKPNTKVDGYDINQDFLDICEQRYSNSKFHFQTHKIDLTDPNATIKHCDLLICNLVLEFLDLFSFVRLVHHCAPKLITVVLQLTIEKANTFSSSPYIEKFRDISYYRSESNPQELTFLLGKAGYILTYSQTHDIDQTKYLIRMDFSKRTDELQD